MLMAGQGTMFNWETFSLLTTGVSNRTNVMEKMKHMFMF